MHGDYSESHADFANMIITSCQTTTPEPPTLPAAPYKNDLGKTVRSDIRLYQCMRQGDDVHRRSLSPNTISLFCQRAMRCPDRAAGPFLAGSCSQLQSCRLNRQVSLKCRKLSCNPIALSGQSSPRGSLSSLPTLTRHDMDPAHAKGQLRQR